MALWRACRYLSCGGQVPAPILDLAFESQQSVPLVADVQQGLELLHAHQARRDYFLYHSIPLDLCESAGGLHDVELGRTLFDCRDGLE